MRDEATERRGCVRQESRSHARGCVFALAVALLGIGPAPAARSGSAREPHARDRRRRGRGAVVRSDHGQAADLPRSRGRLRSRPRDEHLDAGSDRADGRRAPRAAERRSRREGRRRAGVRLGDARGLGHDAADGGGAAAARDLRRAGRESLPRLRRRDRRQRAEPEPVLDAAVRCGRQRRRGRRVRVAARHDLRRRQGRRPGRAGLGRCAGAAGRRQAGHGARHALPHRLHPRSRRWRTGRAVGRSR